MIKYVLWMWIWMAPAGWQWTVNKDFTFEHYDECTKAGEMAIGGYPEWAYRCLPDDFKGPHTGVNY